jgi:hypothetical protein
MPYKHDCPVLGFYVVLNGVGDGPGQLCHIVAMRSLGDWWVNVVWVWEVVERDGRTHMRRFRFMELKISKFQPPFLPLFLLSEQITRFRSDFGSEAVRSYTTKERRIWG